MRNNLDEHSSTAYERRLRWRRRLVSFCIGLLFVLVGLLVVGRLVFFRWVELTDMSMYPTVSHYSTVLALTRLTPAVGDLVVVQTEEGNYLRRIVATSDSLLERTDQGLLLDGQPLERRPLEANHSYLVPSGEGRGATEMRCDLVEESLGLRPVAICVDQRSERAAAEIALAAGEILVLCDNRAYCARHGLFEGVVETSRVLAVGRWLSSTRDDSDQPFYKRWFGRFELLP